MGCLLALFAGLFPRLGLFIIWVARPALVDARMRRFAGRRAVFLHVIAIWLIMAATLIVFSALLSGVKVTSFGAALVAAALIGLFNALEWPLLIRLALPFTVLTLGIGVLVVNGAMILAVATISQSLVVSGLFSGIIVVIGLTMINTLVTSLFGIDDDDFYYRSVIKRQARRPFHARRASTCRLVCLRSKRSLPAWCAAATAGFARGLPTAVAAQRRPAARFGRVEGRHRGRNPPPQAFRHVLGGTLCGHRSPYEHLDASYKASAAHSGHVPE
jgi:uncharacterized membrane protein YvlD (DUF360 family)